MGSIEEWAKARGIKPLHPETAKNTRTPEPDGVVFEEVKESKPFFRLSSIIAILTIIFFAGGGFYYGFNKTKTKEKPVEKIVEKIKYVDKVIEKPVIKYVDKIRYVDKVVVKYVDKIIEKPVEKVVEKVRYVEKRVPDMALSAENQRLRDKINSQVLLLDRFFDKPLPPGRSRKLIWNKSQCECPATMAAY